jgi:hypothetical protein
MFVVMEVAQLNQTKTIKRFRKPGQRYLDFYQMRMVRLHETVRAQGSNTGSGGSGK